MNGELIGTLCYWGMDADPINRTTTGFVIPIRFCGAASPDSSKKQEYIYEIYVFDLDKYMIAYDTSLTEV